MGKFLIRAFSIFWAVVAATCGIATLTMRESMPVGSSGAEADALARQLQSTVGAANFIEKAGAVRFVFSDVNHYIWDKQRNFVSLEWTESDVKRLALFALNGPQFRAYENGQEITGDNAKALVDMARAAFVHDSFWLMPQTHFFDDGAERQIVKNKECNPCMLVKFATGAQAGNAYLWPIDAVSGLPPYWRLWAVGVPVDGAKVELAGWNTLSSGARVALEHRALGVDLHMSQVVDAPSLRELVGESDPFAVLVTGHNP